MNLHMVWPALISGFLLVLIACLGVWLGQRAAQVPPRRVSHDAENCAICQAVETLSDSTFDREVVVGAAQVLANVLHHPEDQLMDGDSISAWQRIYGMACARVVAVGREWLEELLVNDRPELRRLLTEVPDYKRSDVYLDEGRMPLVLSYVEFFEYCGMDTSSLLERYAAMQVS